MAPWCADGEMPTCANLNLYGGSGSRVRWHSDNEGLFGKQEEYKLIVSMSFGVSALFIFFFAKRIKEGTQSQVNSSPHHFSPEVTTVANHI